MNLIKSVQSEVKTIETLYENVTATPFGINTLVESADKLIGSAIASLKAGKNPFEINPESREVIAGLMLLAKDSNREALNINDKKFDLVSKFANEKDAIKKYVAGFAQKHGQSLIKNLEGYVNEEDKREVLTKKLIQLQHIYSKVKQKASSQEQVQQAIAV